MKALALLNGDPPLKSLLARHSDAERIYVADGAAHYARVYGIRPTALIGDFDSADPDAVAYFADRGVGIIKLQPEKDETDAQVLCDLAADEGADSLVILGGIGRRLDHTMGNLQLLIRMAKRGIDACMEDANNRVYALNGQRTFAGSVGGLLSIVPAGEDTLVWTEGLQYPLQGRRMPLDAAFGISNRFSAVRATVRTEGWAFVFLSVD